LLPSARIADDPAHHHVLRRAGPAVGEVQAVGDRHPDQREARLRDAKVHGDPRTVGIGGDRFR
jgi:hypothetical protein